MTDSRRCRRAPRRRSGCASGRSRRPTRLKADGENAEGENADGLNADGENADGLNADGENADGLNADG